MGPGWRSLLVLCALAGGASAEKTTDLRDRSADDVELHEAGMLYGGCEHIYARLWPQAPTHKRATMSQQITDELTELGNLLGHHVNTLSNETLSLGFDGRKRRAKFRVGLADDPDRLITFKLVGDVHFTKGRARATVKLDIGVGERVLHVELRDVEMTHTEYRGDSGIALVIPVFKREF